MMSYISELGGVVAGLSAARVFSRYVLTNIASTNLVCDDESAVLSSTGPLTDSIFHRLEGDRDLVIKIKDLQTNWCCGIGITYAWVKGHTDDPT
jgi:hypothetical protein